MKALLSLVLFSSLALAQTEPKMYSFSGSVLEKGTRKPLAEVNVYLLPEKQKAVSDKKGHFEFKDLTNKDVQVVVNLTNYNKYDEELDLSEEPTLKIYLEKQSSLYFETTISDSKSKKDDSQQSMKQEEFMKMPGSGGDPVKAVQNLPGVNRPSGFSSQIIIQGADPSDTRYNIDGMDVPLVFHFGGFSSVIQPEAVESVDLLSAGYGASYGDALGGHVGLNLRDPQLDRQHAMAYVDIFNMGALAEGPLSNDSGYMIGGRYCYLGEVLKAASEKAEKSGKTDRGGFTSAPTYYDFNSQYFKKISDKEDFKIVGIASSDDLGLVSNKNSGAGNFHYHTQFYRFIPEWHRTFENQSKLDMTLAYGVNNILVDVGPSNFTINSNQYSGRTEYLYPVNDIWKTTVGLDANMTHYDINVQAAANLGGSGQATSFKDQVKSNIIGYLWKNDVKPSAESAWTVSPGLRVDQFSVTNQTLPEPRLSVKYAWSKTLDLKAMSGLVYQLPQPQHLNANVGNPDLKTQRAVHLAAGFGKTIETDIGQSASFSALGFYKKLDQLVITSSATITRNGQLVNENYNNDGVGYIRGIELSSKLKRANWSVTVNYTFAQSFLQQPGQPYYPSPYDQTHSLAVLGSYKTAIWEFGARARYVTGNPFTPAIGSFYNDQGGIYIPEKGTYYSSRLPGFFQIDFRADRKWVYDTWILSYYIDVQNVTNAKNVESIVYSYDYSQSGYITGIPILPTVGMKGEF